MTNFIKLPFVEGKNVGLVGLGITGLAVAKTVLANGANLFAWDDQEQKRNEAKGLPLTDLNTIDFKTLDYLVWSPGIPHSYPAPHPFAIKAKEAGLDLISDIELLVRAHPKAHYITITGTNGKSTTTSLIGHILSQAGKAVATGGNLGTAAISLPSLPEDGYYVLEMSSYQLELTPSLKSHVAILLNITPDHLERHGGMEGYIASKELIFKNQTREDLAIIGLDDPVTEKIYQKLVAEGTRKIIPISIDHAASNGVQVSHGWLNFAHPSGVPTTLDLRAIRALPGRHNWQNAAAAFAATQAMGVDPFEILQHLHSFKGLAHRQEFVGDLGPLHFINDSKATNMDAAGKALSCYDNIYWIAGGQPKENGIEGVEAFLPHINHVFLIGDAAETFAAYLEGKVKITVSHTLDKAVIQATQQAFEDECKDATILLSPACASWDQYKSFEERGNMFKKHVSEVIHQGVPLKRAV